MAAMSAQHSESTPLKDTLDCSTSKANLGGAFLMLLGGRKLLSGRWVNACACCIGNYLACACPASLPGKANGVLQSMRGIRMAASVRSWRCVVRCAQGGATAAELERTAAQLAEASAARDDLSAQLQKETAQVAQRQQVCRHRCSGGVRVDGLATTAQHDLLGAKQQNWAYTADDVCRGLSD